MPVVLTTARRLAALGLCAAASLAAFATPPAHAAPAGAVLYITVTPVSDGAYSMRLTCDPDGGLHPYPVDACDAIRSVDGDLFALNYNPGPCPKNYDPVRVEVRGHWYGQPISFDEKFSNRCVMERTLGPVTG
ncbi:SSI family serine proteinase inhibitor [Nonomuraea sp. NPDC004297]